jgi:hypothetical protein
MFDSKTVFIVGAGASQEAGLPTGAQLKAIIADKLNITYKVGIDLTSPDTGDGAIAWALVQHVGNTGTGDINPYLSEAWKIRDAMPQAISIDNFLDTHSTSPGLVLCGKLGIARAIIDAEHKSRLFIDNRHGTLANFDHNRVRDTWYLKLFQLLSENVRIEEAEHLFNNVSFIIFNYDRCVEHYLFHAIQNYYTIGAIAARQLMSRLTISHPYGLVGSLPWQGPASVEFGGRMNVQLLDIANEIRTFTERMEDNDALGVIRHQVQEAHTIVFLGFAFHPLNMKLLAPGKRSNVKKIFGTAKGISNADSIVVARAITNALQVDQHAVIRNDLTSAGLFDEYWRSLAHGL